MSTVEVPEQEVEELLQFHVDSKRPSQKRLTPKEIVVEVKYKARRGKCVGAAELETRQLKRKSHKEIPSSEATSSPSVISDDMWYLISGYIEPEDVQRFALICRQTAAIVSTRHFWNTLYRKYCVKSNLPAYEQLRLQYAHSIKNEGAQALRQLVIRSLVICHKPLHIAERNLSIERLLGQTFLTAFCIKNDSLWLMCYKFWNNLSPGKKKSCGNKKVVSDWEQLLDPTDARGKQSELETMQEPNITASDLFVNPHEGVSTLAVACDSFTSIHTQLLYAGSEASQMPLLFINYREKLSRNLLDQELELDFANPHSTEKKITVRYPGYKQFSVIPWWHPQFNVINPDMSNK